MRKQFSLERIGQSRGLLMGLAALWVALYHSRSMDFTQSHILTAVHLAGPMQYLKYMGNAGVDVFLFLSGYGLYHSLAGHPGIRQFYSRRFLKILPPVLIVTILYYGWTGTAGIREYTALNLHYALYHGSYDMGQFWYFSLLIVLYLLYPLIHRVVRRMDWKGALGLIVFFVAAALAIRMIDSTYFGKIEIALTRVPVFIAGAWAGKKSREGAAIPGWAAAAALAAAIGMMALAAVLPVAEKDFSIIRYVYGMAATCFCIGAAWLDRMVPANGLRRFIVLIGLYSMEIYLIYEPLYMNLTGFFKVSDGVGITYAAACFTATMLLAFGLKKASGIITEAIRKPGKADRA